MQITIKTGNYKDELIRANAKHIADLNQALRSLEDGSFVVRADKSNPKGLFQIEYAGVNTTDDAEQRQVIKCFKASIGEFITFLDRMIAITMVGEEGIPVKKPVIGEVRILEFVTEYINKKIRSVARNISLSNPKKLDKFYNLTPDIKKALNGYFAIRRALEHHSGIPDQDIEFITLSLKVFVDETEVTKLPFPVKEGQAVQTRIVKESKILKAEEKINLIESDLRKAVFTMEQVASSEVVAIVHNSFKHID